MLKKIAIRLICLVVIIAALDIIYTRFFYPADVQAKSKELLELRDTQESTDIYYFGESSNNTYAEDDSAKNSISEFAAMFFPSLRFTNLNKPATHAGVYKYWLKQLQTDKKLPLAVILTLNLRSFNAAWIHSGLETQLQEALVFAQPLPNIINRFMLSLQAFDNKTEAQRDRDMLRDWKTTTLRFPYAHKYKTVSEWDYAMAMGGYLKPDGTWDTEKSVLACHYIKAYALNLGAENPRIRDFDEIAAWTQKHNVKLFLNLMAENVQYADSLVGRDLVFLMKENRDFLVNRYQKNNCKVIDNLAAIPGKWFIDQKWTTEHYFCKGRMRIAKHIADTLKRDFMNEYKPAY